MSWKREPKMIIWYQIVREAAEEAYQREVIDNDLGKKATPKDDWIKNRIAHWVKLREEKNHGQNPIPN